MKLKPLGPKGHLESYCIVTRYLEVDYLHRDVFMCTVHVLFMYGLCTGRECVMMSLCSYPVNKVLLD